ncbi:GTP cyclohydrolase II RibA [Nocardia sp. BMG51109]|uniref:GTP cyclohydrolase II RibA n=1 Tax=Nocardia sp. BMG51109 TaxID=1056816 RepID=UPI0009FFFDBB|nr:GTP cyclohydrolase II RibA [Nocardia sp. BMG51109]
MTLTPIVPPRSPSSGIPRARIRARIPAVLSRGVRADAELVTFDHLVDGREHLAIVPARPARPHRDVPLVRVHSECLTGDVFGCDRCRCGPELRHSLIRIAQRGGALLYLRQEGRGIGLYNKLDAYLVQDAGYDTYEANRILGHDADERDYRVAAQMLFALGMPRIELLTGNRDKIRQLRAYGIEITAANPPVPTGA